MAGQLKINGVTLATEDSSVITLENPQIKDSSNNLILDQSGTLPVLKNVQVVNDSSMMFRNLLINGDMRIDQRNAGASATLGTTTNDYIVDRFHALSTSGYGSGTMQQVEDAPIGFKYSLQVTSTSSATPTGTQNGAIGQNIEGLNIQNLNWGTSNAKSLTLSFYAKSSLSGTYSVNIRNNDNSRTYVTEVNIPSSWGTSPITVTIPGDANGTWSTSNNIGMRVSISLGAGPDRQTSSLNTWQGTFYQSSTSSNNLFSGSYTFNITGVQLEVGNQATPFEHRPYGVELGLCQRYFRNVRWDYAPCTRYNAGGGTGKAQNTVHLQPEMRATPSYTVVQFEPTSTSGFTGDLIFLVSAKNVLSTYATASCTAGQTLYAHGNANLEAEL